ncbi:MAG: hypothetical protein D6759_00400, partial [Chloroflexi bacterium]
LYKDECATCHGEDGSGVVPNARNFGDVDYMRGQTPARFYVIITEGRNEMPSFKDKFSDEERWNLAFYVWTFAVGGDTLEQGQAIFKQNCAVCHGEDGTGIVPNTPNFTDVSFVAQRSATDFFQVVTEGRGAMPAWQGRLSPEERWAVIEYVRTFAYEPVVKAATAAAPSTTGGGEASPAPTEAPAASEATTLPAVFTQNGCTSCHGDKAQGGAIGPMLVGLKAEHIEHVVRNGRPGTAMVAYDQATISDEDLKALAQALSAMTPHDVGVELSQAVVDHLTQAQAALEAGDKAAVETHLKKAQEAAADAPMGVQVTLQVMVQHMQDPDWDKYIGMRLAALLGP